MADPWISAWFDPLAGLDAASGACALLANVSGNSAGGHELIVGTRSKTLKLVDSSLVSNRSKIGTGIPSAMATLRPAGSARGGGGQCIAVGVGHAVLVYRNMRPFFRFTLPNMPVSPLEVDLMGEIGSGLIGARAACERAASIVQSGQPVSMGVAQLAAAASSPLEAAQSALAQAMAMPGTKVGPTATVITAMCTAFLEPDSGRNWADSGAKSGSGPPSTLVIASEAAQVLLLTRDAMAVEWTITLESPAYRLRFEGSLAMDYRIAALCRDGQVRIIRNGRRTHTIDPRLPVADVVLACGCVLVGMVDPAAHDATMSTAGWFGSPRASVSSPSPASIEGPITTATGGEAATATRSTQTMDGGLIEAFSARYGTRMWVCRVPSPVLCLAHLDAPQTGPGAVIAALSDGSCAVVNHGNVLARSYLTTSDDTVVGLLFGRFGREDHSLVAVLRSGALAIKVLKRTVRLAPLADGGALGSGWSSAGLEQDSPLDIPKRTRLHLQNVYRELEGSPNMYRIFARGLFMLRLRVKREYARVVASSANPHCALPSRPTLSAVGNPSLMSSAEVEGIGPSFRVTIRLMARTGSAVRHGCLLVATAEVGNLQLSPSLQSVPPVTPGTEVVLSLQTVCEPAPGGEEESGPGGRLLVMVTPPVDMADGSLSASLAPLALIRVHIPATDFSAL